MQILVSVAGTRAVGWSNLYGYSEQIQMCSHLENTVAYMKNYLLLMHIFISFPMNDPQTIIHLDS